MVAVVGLATAAVAASAPAAASSSQSLDAATKKAVDLQRQVEALKADQVSLQLRLDSIAYQLKTQEAAAAKAQAEADTALAALSDRAVSMYKSSDGSELALLVGAVSWDDLITRASLVTRMLETDSRLLREAEAAAETARREAEYLERLQREGFTLRELQKRRLASMNAALADQKRIVATLTDAQKKALASRRTGGGSAGKGSQGSIPKGPVIVHPYDNVTFLAADYAPRVFRATGQTFSGQASWYGKAVDGHKTASGRIFNHDDFTTAHRSLPFGTWLAVTRGDRRIVVMVTDRGPYVSGRVLDLSEAAADALGFTRQGVASVTAEVIVRD